MEPLTDNWAEIAGYAASALVFVTFCMKTLIPLRLVAIASNLAFIAYSYGAGLLPVLILHGALLPLNIYRTVEQIRTFRRIRKAARDTAEVSSLLPFMQHRRRRKGSEIFRKGEMASEIFYLARGRILIPELGKHLEAGNLLGEIGLFTTDKKRTASAICDTDCDLYVIGEDDIVRLCHRDPAFGLFLTKLITSRMAENMGRLEHRIGILKGGPPDLGTGARRMAEDVPALN